MPSSRFVTDYEVDFLSPPDASKGGTRRGARQRPPKFGRAGLDGRLRFDPTQRRDDHGRWSVFGGIPLSAQDLHLSNGSVRLEARADGLHIDLTDRAGRTNRSNGLDDDSLYRLASLLGNAADSDDQPTERVTQPVHTFGTDGPGDAATGYAQVTYGAGGPIELELLDSDASIELDPAETRVLAEDINRVGAARRVVTESGPLDMFLPGGHQVGLRTTGLDGEPVEARLSGDEWHDVWHAADVLWEGFDEMGTMFDPEVDVDHVTIDTESGPLEMRRIGPADDRSSHIELESPGKFVIRFRTDTSDPIWHARDPVTEYGQAQGWIDE